MTDKNKENIAKLMIFAMSQAQVQQMDQASKDLAHCIKMQYDAYCSEGFTKAQAIHFTDLFLAGIIGRIG